jgi:hypothetical protein
VDGLSCNAKTFPLRCRWCGHGVFYFSCDCGSKVFFEALAAPWPQHDCRGLYGTDTGGVEVAFGPVPADASRIVRSFAAERGLRVPSLPWEEGRELDAGFLDNVRKASRDDAPISRAELVRGALSSSAA